MTPDAYGRWGRSYGQASHQITSEGINTLLHRTKDKKRDRTTDDDAESLSRSSKRQHVSNWLGFCQSPKLELNCDTYPWDEATTFYRTPTMLTTQLMPALGAIPQKQSATIMVPTSQLDTEDPRPDTEPLLQTRVSSTDFSQQDKLRLFFTDPPAVTVTQMEQKMEQKMSRFVGFENGLRPEHCWLDADALSKISSRSIQIYVPYWYKGKSLRFRVAYGVIALFLKRGLSEDEIDGLTSKPPMQLSHLCGNWHCCNPEHMVIESKKTNMSRNCNTCLTDKGKMMCGEGTPLYCPHQPKCMVKHRLWKADLVPICMRASAPALPNSQSISD